jgi:nucleoside-diphosphate-sugar epimerase
MKNNFIIFGKSGFIASELAIEFKKKKAKYKFISSKEINLLSSISSQKLKKFKKKSTIIFLSALTPDKGKGIDIFEKNIKMIINFFKFYDKKFIDHFIYISSDAVYSTSNSIIDESLMCSPQDLYGVMHYAREVFLKENLKNKLTILRPTLVFGSKDTHNSYGPNRLVRSSIKEGKLYLFGKGLDQRDHIYVKDLVKIILIFSFKKISGEFNVATGASISFFQIAKIIKKHFHKKVKFHYIKNDGKISIRKFRINKLRKVIKNFKFTNVKQGLENYFN